MTKFLAWPPDDFRAFRNMCVLKSYRYVEIMNTNSSLAFPLEIVHVHLLFSKFTYNCEVKVALTWPPHNFWVMKKVSRETYHCVKITEYQIPVWEFMKTDLIHSGRINRSSSTSEKNSEPESTIWAKRITASCVQNTPMMMMNMRHILYSL